MRTWELDRPGLLPYELLEMLAAHAARQKDRAQELRWWQHKIGLLMAASGNMKMEDIDASLPGWRGEKAPSPKQKERAALQNIAWAKAHFAQLQAQTAPGGSMPASP